MQNLETAIWVGTKTNALRDQKILDHFSIQSTTIHSIKKLTAAVFRCNASLFFDLITPYKKSSRHLNLC